MKGAKLYVSDDGKNFTEIAGLAVGPNIGPLVKITIADACQKYVSNFTALKCENNQKSEVLYFKIFCEFMRKRDLGYMDQIKLVDIDEFVTFLSKRMKPVSVNRRMSTIKNFLNKCYEWQFIVSQFKIKKKKSKPNPHRVWPENVYNSFLERTEGVHTKFFRFLWLTGCRPIEAANLKWTDIDHEKQIITLSCGKNAEISRAFPMTKELSKLLHEMKPERHHVFFFKGKPMNTACLYVYVQDRLKYVTKEKYTMYGLRHTFGFRLNRAGANAFAIANLMGHSDLKTTRNYMHTSETDLISLLNKA
jgi:integrase